MTDADRCDSFWLSIERQRINICSVSSGRWEAERYFLSWKSQSGREAGRHSPHTWDLLGAAGGQLSLTRTICLQHTQPHATQTLSDNLVGEIQTRPSVSYYETLDKALGEARQTSSFEKSKQWYFLVKMFLMWSLIRPWDWQRHAPAPSHRPHLEPETCWHWKREVRRAEQSSQVGFLVCPHTGKYFSIQS